MILAGDVGATKILLEAGDFRSGRWESAFARRYAIVDYANMHDVVEAFLGEWERAKANGARLETGGIGVAGPVEGNTARMTNRPWIVDGDALAVRFGLKYVRIVNDLAATARGVEFLADDERLVVQEGHPDAGAPRVVLGVGTGLGVAYLVPDRDGALQVVPGEGGHAGFSPASHDQAELAAWLFARHGRVENEHIVSGLGMSNVYRFVRQRGGAPAQAPESLQPAEIVDAALGRGDHTAIAALNLFVESMGAIAGDHALSCLARGGVYISGGVAGKIAHQIKTPRFLSAFCAKGAMSDFMMRVPVCVSLPENVPVWGAARCAMEG